MKISFQKKIEIDYATGEDAAWYYVYSDSKCHVALKDEGEARRRYNLIVDFYKKHGAFPYEETISEIELPNSPQETKDAG